MKPDNVPRNPTLLVILDGVGWNPNKKNNGVAEANTPHLDKYFEDNLFTTLQASGNAVGLPDGQMGNSEVGHLTIGSGNILFQDLVRINQSIEDKSFFNNPTFLDAIHAAKKNQRPLHLLGLVSDGGVHSHINHLIALIQLCAQKNVIPAIHMITDGRDTSPQSAITYLTQLEPHLAQANGHIATVCGRFYAMDRDKHWDRIKKAWRCLCFAEGNQSTSARLAIETAYENQETDEFIKPVFIVGSARIEAYDHVIFFNFRNDRARQLSYTLAGKEFKPFQRKDFQPISLSSITEYDPLLPLPIAFPLERPETTLAETISQQNIRQLHCAETEKYAHVTFFFNGGREAPFPGEERQIIPSPNVTTYDQAPEMAAKELTDELIQAIESQKYGFIVTNYANGDLVGHTAKREAILKAVETLDTQVNRLLTCAKTQRYSIILTADHGNCDEMIDSVTGEPHTQHTTHPVPCMLIDNESDNWRLKTNAGLSQIAPTVLKLMGIKQPNKMKSSPIFNTKQKTLNL